MDSVHRRMEIISILSAKGHVTMAELAWELEVSRRTIMNDIISLSFDYPVYTKPGEGGGGLQAHEPCRFRVFLYMEVQAFERPQFLGVAKVCGTLAGSVDNPGHGIVCNLSRVSRTLCII